jgi:hypothetical protein
MQHELITEQAALTDREEKERKEKEDKEKTELKGRQKERERRFSKVEKMDVIKF